MLIRRAWLIAALYDINDLISIEISLGTYPVDAQADNCNFSVSFQGRRPFVACRTMNLSALSNKGTTIIE